jgi:PAT family beta-lactamase induction signal transducer AmpG
MLLGPFVDLTFTKRGWILGGQAIIAAGLVVAAFLLKTPNAFGFSLVILGLTAVMSALCNIATDGFAILAMSRTQQAQFAGIMSTFYRLGRLFCASLLVFAAGRLAARGMSQESAWFAVPIVAAAVYAVLHLVGRLAVPHVEERRRETPPIGGNLRRTLYLLAAGVGSYFLLNALVRLTAHGLFLALPDKVPGWALPETNSIPFLGWTAGPVGTEVAQFAFCAALVVAAALGAKKEIKGTEFGEALGSFARQDGFAAILFFILFYRFAEAMVGKVSVLFLKSAPDAGGLGLANDQIGILNGFLGVLGIICGGIAGGWTVSRIGLRRAFLPLALAMHVPNLLYLLASYGLLPMFTIRMGDMDLNASIGVVLFVDQFGYGFGFAAYMVYLMWVAQRGRFQTSHYAIATGLGALCIATAGVLSGVVLANWGYRGVFWVVMIASLPGLISLLLVPLDESHRSIQVSVD